ncbi:ABC transporter permease [Paenibacillus sp. GCM10027626]|uniref:ABC transporter permease n=1 Tax=Paenibacillus sp. GCM10027626 TaxID=3273411 RepID=UPI00362DAC96
MGAVFSSELLKIRKKMIWFLIFLGPVGVVGLQSLNFGLRYDYLTKLHAADLWGGLLDNILFLTVPTLFVGLAIIASMTAGIEHQTNTWKQTLALPVSRTRIFAGKFLLNVLLLFCSATLLIPGFIALGAALGFPLEQLPYKRMLEAIYLSYIGVMPFIALQVSLSVLFQHQAVSLMVGIAGTVISMFAFRFADWVPYKWVYLHLTANNPFYPAIAGIALGIALFLIGLLYFIRKDVN